MSIGSSDSLASLLERIRCCFCVRAAMVQLLDDEGVSFEISAGAPIPWPSNPAARRLQALAATEIVIVPDIGLESDAASEDAKPRVRFFSGIPLFSEKGRPFGVLSLFHPQPRWLSPVHVRAFEDLAAQLAPLALRRRNEVVIARLKVRLQEQASTIRAQADELTKGRSTFERAATDARLGMWECALHDDGLTWTDQVYDLFDIPSGARLSRQKTLECYTPASRTMLERTRADAIVCGSGFRLDAEIVTMKGCHRWIRLTAAVDCRDGSPVRLFGIKQDITEQKLLLDETRYLAEFDVMTGLANRAQFKGRLSKLETEGAGCALLLIDLDGFKQVNDGFGHSLGDACLQEAAQRLRSVCGEADLVARLGGDEFGVLLGSAASAAEPIAAAIVTALAKPMQCGEHLFRIGASVGIAAASGSWTPSDLFTRADTALYAAKAAGRGTFRTFEDGMASGRRGRMPWAAGASSERHTPQ